MDVPGMKSCSAVFSLVDMPSAWMQQLLGQLKGHEVLALFRSCIAMRDMVLSERRCNVRMNQIVVGRQTDDALMYHQEKLALACKYSVARVNLSLQQPPLNDFELFCMSSAQIVRGAMRQLDRPLTAIVSAELRALTLDAFLPSWLSQTCPCMSRLSLIRCQLDRHLDPSLDPLPCSQIRHLSLSDMPSRSDDEDTWQYHLRSLTNLTDLEISLSHYSRSAWLETFTTVGQLLTSLAFAGPERGGPWPEHHLATWFPNLHKVNLTATTVTDAGAAALFSMHHLTDVKCRGFLLQQDHTQLLCRWMSLCVCEHMEVASYSRLPARALQVLRNTADSVWIATEEEGCAPRIVAALSAALSNSWSTFNRVTLVNPMSQAVSWHALMQCVAVGVACHPRQIVICGLELFEASLLPQLSHHLSAWAGIVSVVFSDCHWTVESCLQLLPSLPKTVTEVFVEGGIGLSEARIVGMCLQRVRPMTFGVDKRLSYNLKQLRGGSGKRWQHRVRAALARAGEPTVTFKTFVSFEDASEWDEERAVTPLHGEDVTLEGEPQNWLVGEDSYEWEEGGGDNEEGYVGG